MTRSPGDDALAPQRACRARHLVAERVVGVALHRARHRTVVDQRELLAAPALDVQVERVEAGVEPATREPAVEGRARVVEDLVPAPLPVDVLGGRGPEPLGIPHGPLVDLLVDAGHRLTPLSAAPRSQRARAAAGSPADPERDRRPTMAMPARLASCGTRYAAGPEAVDPERLDGEPSDRVQADIPEEQRARPVMPARAEPPDERREDRQVPQRLVEKGRVEELRAPVLERPVRRRDVEPPGQIRRPPEGLLVEEVSPAPDGLGEGEGRARRCPGSGAPGGSATRRAPTAIEHPTMRPPWMASPPSHTAGILAQFRP